MEHTTKRSSRPRAVLGYWRPDRHGSDHAVVDSPVTNNRGRTLQVRIQAPRWMRRLMKKAAALRPARRKHPFMSRVGWGFLAVVMLGAIFIDWTALRQSESRYSLSPRAQTLLGHSNPLLAEKLKFDAQNGTFQYNEGYTPAGGGVAGTTASPKFTASFSVQPEKGATVTDPVTETSMTFQPTFGLAQPRQEGNRLVYPIKNQNAVKVSSLRSIGMKEDIILNAYHSDSMSYSYTLVLSEGTEARLEASGALAIYGAQTELLGNVSTATPQDAALLKTARKHAKKDTLLFTVPAPFVKEFNKKTTSSKAWFELEGNTLTLHASGLAGASYPISIDPSVYIETAAKLMRGNNETNVDFDIDDELIQKSQTTGARIDTWQDNLDMNQAVWDHGAAAAGGYVYRVGGRTGTSKPAIVDSATTLDSTDGTSFTMDMPATRPAGDLYIAMFCHDGSSGSNVTAPVGGGWTEFADLQGYAAYWKVGTNQGGGNEAATYQWTGPNEKYAGVIVRITGFNTGDPISGAAGTGSNSSNLAVPVFPATTPDSDATLVVRGAGFDEDSPIDRDWVPTGHTKVAEGNSGGTGDCGFVSASLDNPPVSGVSTGTATLADATLQDDYGASSIAINPVSVTPATQSGVYWAKFDSSSLSIESPVLDTGACSGWCTNSAYDLPEARRGFSLVTYNGYLYVIGGIDGSGNRESTVLIAKLGANGEPSLWHPSGGTPAYWYQDAGLSSGTARSYTAAVAYNNRMYILGGATNASATGTTTMEYASINPAGTLGSWSSGTALPSARYRHSAHIYNDVLYLLGGDSAGSLQNTVYYNKLNIDGTMNTWTQTAGFSTARSTMGGSFTAVWGAYLYLGGGCITTTGAANYYCSAMASDMQIASINADGTISEWSSLGIQNQRIGYTFIAWQNGLYRLGGCTDQNTSTGECRVTLADVDYGVINPAGEVSTVNISVPSGTSPCSGGSPYGCDLPPPGDDAGEGGQMLSMSAVMNGFLYVIGGCIDYDCQGTAPAGDDADATGNVSYVAIDPNGRLTAPASCSGTSYGAWCVDATNRVNGTTGVAAAGVTTFNGRIYIVGGLTGAGVSPNIYYNTVTTNGSLAGAWSSVDMTTAGIAEDVAYTYVYARANPSSAGTNPGNLYVFGGCGTNTGGAGCGSTDYETEVYKCNIDTAGSVSGCTTTGQLQIDSTPGAGGTDGLGIHSGTVYANYIFLVGGFSQAESDKDDVLYARFDNNNNVVAVSGGAWVESANKLSVGRRRGFSFGYNGHIYSVGGYDADGSGVIIPFIEWAKMNVSNGDIDPFETSTVTINQRWGLSMVVSNSYAYVIGGCDNGASPGDCTSFEASIQTFQLYNNDSGAVNNFTSQGDQTFAANTERIGAASTVYNGYLYVAGGCTDIACTAVTDNVQYAPLSASDGTVGTWASTSDSTLPAGRAWGQLEVAGGTLYYIGGQTATATDERPEIYYGTPSSGDVSAWNTVNTSFDLPDGRTQHGTAVWNNRLYVVGGIAAATGNPSSTVYVSPQLNSGGDIGSTWSTSTAFNVARSGAAVTAYANNLYLFGGFDGTNYLSDAQFTQINSDGTVDGWSYTTNLPIPLRDSRAVSANGYIYVIGGRSAASTCAPKTLITPVSANTTIASGNNPTGIGEWYETNVKYAGDRFGAAVAYDKGKIYTMGGGCTALVDGVSATRHYHSTVKSQPQVAKYSRMIDTDTDVFPNSWLMNGVDNSIGARWTVRYRSMNDTDADPTDCGSANMTTWGQETNYGDVTLGDVALYTPRDGSGLNTNCARYYYFFVSIDASKTFGYPEDVTRGPTMTDLSLFFSSDPSKRLRHGKTFTGGEQQPFDTPCRQSVDADCPLP